MPIFGVLALLDGPRSLKPVAKPPLVSGRKSLFGPLSPGGSFWLLMLVRSRHRTAGWPGRELEMRM